MSNLYVTEPATNGKVIIDTTAGEIEVELWGKEAPLAVRNFLALAMEGYYDGVIFHRVVPGFIVQSGDPTGTGMGGESVYGEPFNDEIHGRLKFNRRGLLGMANNSKRNTNNSQFFFTLDRADELTGKHTLFGKIAGNTIYNVMNIGNLELDEQEKPVRPPKIRTVRIIENPFDDIVPRITREEREAQRKAKIEAKREAEIREKRAKAKKNTGLLSFGDSEEIPTEATAVKRKGMGREDLVEVQPDRPKPVPSYVDLPPSVKDLAESSSKSKKTVDLREIRAQHQKDKESSSAARQAEIKEMQENLRKLKKRTGEVSDSESDEESRKRRRGPSYLEEELAKYQKGRGRAILRSANTRKRREEEDDLLAAMTQFSKKVSDTPLDALEEEEERTDEGQVEEGEPLEVDDDVDWMRHSLKFLVDEKELTRRAEDEYAVIDPRAKARELADEEKKRGHHKGSRRD